MTAPSRHRGLPAAWIRTAPTGLARRAALLFAAVVALLTAAGAPAWAHDGLRLTIQHDGRGSVWVAVAWDDGHEVTEPVGATFTARESQGRTVTPQPMRTAGSSGSVVYTGTLPPGRWTVDVEVATPGAVSCAAVLVVGPDAPAESLPCDGAPLAASGALGGTGSLLVAGLLAVGALVPILLIVLALRRTRTGAYPAGNSEPAEAETAATEPAEPGAAEAAGPEPVEAGTVPAGEGAVSRREP
ncbi:hypothetical protein AB0J86_16585 [Micromonospora sp. NPDC049559]|uniref:hypothetical protein n=1 Tax=Micromonospora sp. NPDC049559 TaxID=3155923 RepID=UPI003435C835